MSLLEGYRLFTGYYIYESEMASEAKLEFVKFLKEAKADDIIDILSGQYEGVDGLTETEMKALHSFIEEKYGMAMIKKGAAKAKEFGIKGAAKAKAAGKAGAMKAGAAGKAAAMKAGAAGKAGAMKAGAAGKAGAAKGAEGVKKGAGAAYRGTFKTAVGRTALAGAGGIAAGAGGMAAYKKKK